MDHPQTLCRTHIQNIIWLLPCPIGTALKRPAFSHTFQFPIDFFLVP